MEIPKLSRERVKRFWLARLPGQEALVMRFASAGVLPQDHGLALLELVCACSLMVESRTVYAALQAVERLENDSIELVFGEPFFVQLQQSLAEMQRAGLRAQARRLRKLGQGIAVMQDQGEWAARWRAEMGQNLVSAIKDEPFLPQQG